MTEGLDVDHLRLMMGTSMGCMHAFVWGETYPDFMDALMPLACLPVQIAGRNRMWREMVIDAIRHDPAWKGGEYKSEPRAGLRTAATCCSSPAARRCRCRRRCRPATPPTPMSTRRSPQAICATLDANDFLYQVECLARLRSLGRSSDKIKAPVMWINSADDFINPPELGIAEREVEADQARPIRADPDQRPDPRPRHAHLGGGVEGLPGGTVEGVGALGTSAAAVSMVGMFYGGWIRGFTHL